MEFLANENVPRDTVEALRAAGHDVAWIRMEAPGSTDEAILSRAARERRVLLTFDKDFGELAWRWGLPAACGVVLLRLPLPAPATGAAIARILGGRQDWAGRFSVIEHGRVRMRLLPRKR